MRRQRPVSALVALASFAATAWSVTPPGILEKKLSFPPSIQWRTADSEISMISLAWGPANSPEMISKGREARAREKPEFFSSRSYVLALGFQAKAPGRASLRGSTCSGLVWVKNIDGELENPSVLTPSGFLALPTVGCGSFDIDFGGSNPTEYWDFFPAPPTQTEFLFEVYPPTGVLAPKKSPALSFRVLVKENDLEIVNTSPPAKINCPDFTRDYTGTVGSSSEVYLQLTQAGADLSGAHKHLRTGATLMLKGKVDSLGNFALEEQSPENRMMGIFKGRFSDGCRIMNGYFSKPDGSELLPFQFQEIEIAD